MSFDGKRLKEIRKKKKITQAELAKKAGIGVASLIRYENGERQPNLDMIIKLAKALELENVDILQFDDNLRSSIEKTMELMTKQLPQNQLLEAFQNLNEDGQNKVIEYANDITPKYKK